MISEDDLTRLRDIITAHVNARQIILFGSCVRQTMSSDSELPITSHHALAVESLPPLHKDPFDRILIAQAITEGILFLTADSLLTKYPGAVRRV